MFGVVFLLAALCVGLTGFLTGSATAGARAGLGALTGSSGGFRVTIPRATNAAVQHARVRKEIRCSVFSDGHSVPLRVLRDVETLAAVELDAPRGVARPALASIPDLAGRADLLAGSWPAGGVQVTIVGTWRARLL